MQDKLKLVIIDEDGNINKFVIGDIDYYHFKLMSDYAKEKYNQELIKDEIFRNTSTSALFLREQGEMVFLNNTSYANGIPDKHGRCGIIFMPDEITNSQIDAINSFKEEVSDYNDLVIYYNFIDEITCNTARAKNKETLDKAFNIVLDNVKKKGKSK